MKRPDGPKQIPTPAGHTNLPFLFSNYFIILTPKSLCRNRVFARIRHRLVIRISRTYPHPILAAPIRSSSIVKLQRDVV
jgi:hypothetical protein